MLLHLRRGQAAEALPYYERALKAFRRLEPRYHDEHLGARLNYGVCLDHVGRYEDALRTFRDVGRTPPHPAAAFRNAAVLLQREGRTDEVDAVLSEGIAWHPEDAASPR